MTYDIIAVSAHPDDIEVAMGGSGSLPGSMHYCFYGLASCYTDTFATIAAILGIELKNFLHEWKQM